MPHALPPRGEQALQQRQQTPRNWNPANVETRLADACHLKTAREVALHHSEQRPPPQLRRRAAAATRNMATRRRASEHLHRRAQEPPAQPASTPQERQSDRTRDLIPASNRAIVKADSSRAWLLLRSAVPASPRRACTSRSRGCARVSRSTLRRGRPQPHRGTARA